MTKFTVTSESKNDKNAETSMSEADLLIMTLNWSRGSEIADQKSNYRVCQHLYVILDLGLEHKLLYQNIEEFFQKLGKVAIMPGFGSKQSLQQHSFSAWFIVPCGGTVLLNKFMWNI